MFITTQLEAATISLDLLEHHCAHKQVILHWVHLRHAFTTSLTLLFCFCECRARADLQAVPPAEISAKADRCKGILSRFAKWPQCAQFQAILDGLLQQATTPDSLGGSSQVDLNIESMLNLTASPSLPLPAVDNGMWASLVQLSNPASIPSESIASMSDLPVMWGNELAWLDEAWT